MLALGLLALAGACALALADWRRGLYAFVVVALLQDPMRKLVDGQPPIFILFAGATFAAAAAGARLSGLAVGPGVVPGFRRELAVPVAVYLAALVFQGLNGFASVGSPIPPLLGLVGYVAPLAGLGVAVAFARDRGPEGVARFLTFYVALASLFCVSVALQAMGLDSALFGEVGSGIHIFGPDGEIAANCGLFRAAEIAGWHAANAGALGVVLLTRKGFDAKRLALALLFAATLGAVAALTGRRKAPLLILVFGALYFALAGVYLRGALRSGAALAALAPLAYFAASPLLAAPDLGQTSFGQAYFDRAQTAFAEGSDRLYHVAWAPLETVYDVYGPLGGGLGLATQGANYAGLSDDADLTAGAGEGGIGKLAIELGFLGLAAAICLGLAIARRVARVLGEVASGRPEVARFVCGLVALLAANVVNFALAAQTYGDVSILIFLGLLLGAVLAAPRFPREMRHRFAPA